MNRRRKKIAMLVTDSNEGSGMTRKDAAKLSPVLHPAVEILLEKLKASDAFEFEIIYGRANAAPGEARRDGCLSYVPVPYKRLPLPGTPGVFFGRALAILNYLRKSRPDLIHAQGSEREAGFVAALSAPPSVLTLHGILQEIARRIQAPRFSYFDLAARLERFAVARVNLIHCISSHTKSYVEKSARRTRIIPNGVDDLFFQVQRAPSASPRVICVSDITEWKDPITLVEAGDMLHEEFPGTEIHFFGACVETHFYGAAFISAIQSRSWCFFHGPASRSEITAALSKATCAVLPSKAENFGLALAEAMAAGVPCVGADTGGIPDIVIAGSTGWTFPAGDARTLGMHLLEVHRDKAVADKLAAAGKEHAERHFAASVVADQHLTMYHELLTPAAP